MRKLEELQQVPRVLAGDALDPLETVLQRIAVDVQLLSRLRDTAIVIDEAAERLQQIGGILQLDRRARLV